MLRIATPADIPAMLEIYGPYVLNSTATFEYTVPTQEEFTRRFTTITSQYPWLVWEEEGTILGYAYASAPYTRAAYSWCAEPSIYLRPMQKAAGSAQNSTPRWKRFLPGRAIRSCMPWSRRKTGKASPSMKNFPMKNGPFFRTAGGNSTAG